MAIRSLVFLLGLLATDALAAEPQIPAGSTLSAYSLPAPIAREAGTLLSSLRRHDLSAAEISLQRLTDLRTEAGIPNLTPIAAAFRDSFREAARDAPPAVAVRIAAAAVSLAPDDPGLRWTLARAELGLGVEGVGAASGVAIEALKSYQRHPRSLAILAANTTAYLLGSLVLVLLVVVLAFLVRHGRLLAHDLGDLFPSAPATPFSAVEMAQSRRFQAIVGSGLTRMLAQSLVGLLLLLPVVLGFGLVPSAVIWLLLVLPYVRRAEAVAAASAFLLVALLPLLGALVLLPARVAATDGARMWTALEETAGDDLLPTLSRRTMEHPDEPWAPIIQARMEVRRAPLSLGTLDAAASRIGPFVTEPSGVAATDLANIELRRALASCRDGRPGAAESATARQAFDRALRVAPGTPAVLRGLALSAGLLGDRAGVDTALQSLVTVTPDADLDSLARLRSLTVPSNACASPQATAAELRTPDAPDWDIWLADVKPFATPPALPLNSILMGRTPVSWLPILGVAGLVILLVLIMAGRHLPFASACARCGTISCRSCNHEASGFDYCPTCLFEQVKPAFLDPLDVVALQRRREERHDWAQTVLPIVSLVLPGVGQLLSGRPLRGAFLLMILFLAVGAVAFPVAPVIDIDAYAGAGGGGLPLGPPLALAVVYLFSALDTWVNRTS
jgi:hypothetical protein